MATLVAFLAEISCLRPTLLVKVIMWTTFNNYAMDNVVQGLLEAFQGSEI